jgi:26S proteasome regulatory subunit N1
MTISEKRECLKYRFLSTKEDVGSWGHEYVRHLTAELSQEWQESTSENNDKQMNKNALFKLAEDIVQFYMKHNAEADACDLLMEIERLDVLLKYVEKDTYQRVCLYLLGYIIYL